MNGTGLCSNHSRREQDAANFATMLLNPRTRFPVSSHIHRIMHAWTSEPLNTVILDFEFGYPDGQQREIYEIALANAHGEWIVPQTTINHNVTTAELADRSRSKRIAPWLSEHQLIRKSYGTVDYAPTSGMTYGEITERIAQYTEKCGNMKTLLVWSRTHTDFDCLQEILVRTGRENLLPRMPNFHEGPLAWWTLLKHSSGCALDLSLSALYKTLYPENTSLFQRRHSAGADVSMTIQLIEFYFRNVRGQPQQGKLENYFQKSCLGARGDSSRVEEVDEDSLVERTRERDVKDEWETDSEYAWTTDSEDKWNTHFEEMNSDLDEDWDLNSKDSEEDNLGDDWDNNL